MTPDREKLITAVDKSAQSYRRGVIFLCEFRQNVKEAMDEYTGGASDVQAELEALIDRYGVNGVMYAMQAVCEIKAEHIAANWHDKPLAAAWRLMGRAVCRAADGLCKNARLTGAITGPHR